MATTPLHVSCHLPQMNFINFPKLMYDGSGYLGQWTLLDQFFMSVHPYRGPGPSARSNHIATLYDDKLLLIFGGTSKSRTLNDLHSLDFETVGGSCF